MEKLQLFTVADVRQPPLELSRKVEKQLFTCELTLPLSPQLLIFHQGEWPKGETEVTLNIFLGSEKIGQMEEKSKCFSWETDSLSPKAAGEKIILDVKVLGLKQPHVRKQKMKEKKTAAKKSPRLSRMQEESSNDCSKAGASNDSKSNARKKLALESKSKLEEPKVQTEEKIKEMGEDLSETKTPSNVIKGRPVRKKGTASAATAKKLAPATTEIRKTRQTQLNFVGTRKVCSTSKVDEQKNSESQSNSPPKLSNTPDCPKRAEVQSESCVIPVVDTKKNSSDILDAEKGEMDPNSITAAEPNVRVVSRKRSYHRRNKKDTEVDLSEMQLANENTPQMADMPSPLPRKPVKQKRRNEGDLTPEGPTPKKRGIRMRAVGEHLTPKSSRSKLALGDASSKDNIVTPEKPSKETRVNDGHPTVCIDLLARAPRPSARWGHTMLLTQPRCAVLIGGQGDRQQLSKDSVWTLHTDTRKWRCQEIQSEGQKPEYRMGHSATYDPTMRCIYVFGGSKNSRWFHDVHVFDLEENKWSLAKVDGKAPTRAYHTATLHRHEIWIFGGVYPRPDPNPDGCSNDIHIFSPVMQTWYAPLVQGEKPLARSGHSATLISDQMVVFGGWDAPFCYNDLFILDMTTVDWSQPDVKGVYPKPRSWHASCALSNQRILIHGGYDGDNALEDTFIFDLGCLSWSQLSVSNAPKPRAGHAAVCLPYSTENQEEDEVLVFGGGDNDGEFFYDTLSFSVPFKPLLAIE